MRWLLDEMLPHAAVGVLRDLGHDAVSVFSAGLRRAEDEKVYSEAKATDRVIVTEDAAGFVPLARKDLELGSPSVPIVLVRKERLGRGRALGRNLAQELHRWSHENPDPYHGPHWL
jgi:predicted nuclease of predicted toxin-antitoxin system